MDNTGAADPDRPCPHENFYVHAAVNRIQPPGAEQPTAYVADISIQCEDCKEPFRFTGLTAGLSYAHPMVSVDESELRAPIRPASADPDFGLGLPGFSVKTVYPT